jgi:hypothetical protein
MSTYRIWRLMIVVGILAVMGSALPVLAQGDVTTIEAGTLISGAITTDAPEILYTFEGEAGDTITISMWAVDPGLDSYLILMLPDGTEIARDDDSGGNLNSLIGPFSLPEDGAYTVKATRFGGLDGSSTGGFELQLLNVEVAPLTPNEQYTVELNDDMPSAYFSFTPQTDQAYVLTGTSIAGDTGFLINVNTAGGETFNQIYGQVGGMGLIDPLLLPDAGQSHVIEVLRQIDPANAMAGDTVTVQMTLGTVETAPITLGTPVTGDLDPAMPTMHYAFEGAAGDVLRIEAEQIGTEPYEIQVYSPQGYVVNGGATLYAPDENGLVIDPLVLDADGEYLLLVHLFDYQGTGQLGKASYSVTLGETETPALTAGQAMENSFPSPDVYQHVYRYMGTAGEQVRITLESLDGRYGPSLDVQGPAVEAPEIDPLSSFNPGPMVFVLGANSPLSGKLSYEVALPAEGLYLFYIRNGSYTYDIPEGESASTGAFSLLVESLAG